MAINDEQNINLRILDSGEGNSDLNCVEVPGSPLDKFQSNLLKRKMRQAS